MPPRFTPAPWVTVPGTAVPSAGDRLVLPAYVAVIAPHENDVVPVADCAADPQVRSLEQVEANAALIAAAPEMFAALEALIAGDGAARGLARAALAKATAPAPARWPLL